MLRNNSKILNLLALEYNCSPNDFYKSNNIITSVSCNEGQRIYAQKQTFFKMITFGSNVVISADTALHPFLEQYTDGKTGHYLFEIPNLLPIEKELNYHGYTLTQSFHMFLPAVKCEPKKNYQLRWYIDEEIHQFYGDSRFPNAICTEFTETRPDKIVVCAYDNDNIMGMAGCSEDAKGLFQIGIDVMPEYRSMGVGTYLVTVLKNRIIETGAIPFYGTSVSNYHSWNIAINSGFRPAWIEIAAQRIKQND